MAAMLNTGEDGTLALRDKLNRLAKLCLDNGIELPEAVTQPKPAKNLADLPVELLTAIFLEYALTVPGSRLTDRNTMHLNKPDARITESQTRSAVKLICHFGQTRQMRQVAIDEVFSGMTFNMLVTHAQIRKPSPGSLVIGVRDLTKNAAVVDLCLEDKRVPDIVQDLVMSNMKKCHLRLNFAKSGAVSSFGALALVSELDRVHSALPNLGTLLLSIHSPDIRLEDRERVGSKLLRELQYFGVKELQVWMGEANPMPTAFEGLGGKTPAEVLERMMVGNAWMRI